MDMYANDFIGLMAHESHCSENLIPNLPFNLSCMISDLERTGLILWMNDLIYHLNGDSQTYCVALKCIDKLVLSTHLILEELELGMVYEIDF